MDWAFEIGLKNRKILESFLDNLSLEDLNKVPEGFSNNVIWNIAHTIVTQQLLVYSLSGVASVLPDSMIAKYRKGTKVEGYVSQEEVDEIRSFLFNTLEKTQDDYNNQIFKTYTEYTVSTKSTLTKVEDAIDFNNFHEGIHLGYILALKKSI